MKKQSFHYLLSAQFCNAQSEVSIHSLLAGMIDVAWKHVEENGVGFSRLRQKGNAWVMARLALEVKRMPLSGENLLFSTWVEKNNWVYSTRCFQLNRLQEGGEEEECVNFKTYWSIINLKTRTSQSLSEYEELKAMEVEGIPSIPSPAKIPPVEGKVVKEYRVEYSDLDENRHMNTAKYAEHVFDLFPLEFFDKMRLSKLDMMFLREAKFGDMLQFVLQEMPNGEKSIEVRGEGGNAINRIKMSFVEREK